MTIQELANSVAISQLTKIGFVNLLRRHKMTTPKTTTIYTETDFNERHRIHI
jgi:hypothetical protein